MAHLVGYSKRIRQFLVPWASILLVEMILCTTLLLSFIWVGQGSRAGYVSAAIALQIYLFFWYVVWHYYQHLCSQSCQAATETNTIVTDLKTGYISFPTDKPQNV